MENFMNAERKVRLTNQQYIQQRIFNVNPRYANCLSWVYAATGFLELKQMTSNINISMQRGVRSTREDGGTEYKLESAFTVLENIKNTPKYWSKAKMRLRQIQQRSYSKQLLDFLVRDYNLKPGMVDRNNK